LPSRDLVEIDVTVEDAKPAYRRARENVDL